MISQHVIERKGKVPVVRCVICHEEAKLKPQIIQLGVDFCIICPNCINRFPRKDMEYMYNMFSAFGGYFGQLKNTKKSIHEIITYLTREFNIGKEKITLKSDIRLVHKAFLYGIAPKQIVHGLHLIQEES